MIKAKKSLGQNFLTDRDILKKITSIVPIKDKFIMKELGSNEELLSMLHEKGLIRLYIDGGTTINSFLKEDLIDEMIITTIPILLGGGARLFQELLDRFILREL